MLIHLCGAEPPPQEKSQYLSCYGCLDLYQKNKEYFSIFVSDTYKFYLNQFKPENTFTFESFRIAVGYEVSIDLVFCNHMNPYKHLKTSIREDIAKSFGWFLAWENAAK